MNTFVPIALYGWLPIVLLIFRELRGHRAVILVFLAATMFLPVAELPFYGLPEYSKESATAMGVFIAIVLFEPMSLFRFKPRWFDIPVIVYCFSPIPSALVNGLGIGHGISLSTDTIIEWGVPYFVGRLYFRSFDSIRDLAYGIFLGGLVYIPFCLFEMRMSPQLHRFVYGFRPGSWSVERYGGFRPSVFMQQGLELGMFMTAASLLGIWLWRSKLVRRVQGIDVSLLIAVLVITTIFCKCTGAILLLFLGLGALMVSRMARTPIPIIVLALVSIGYIAVRSTGLYDGSHVVSLARDLAGESRAQSLQFRLANEEVLLDRALEMPVFGWGGFGRNRVFDEFGKDLTITDGYWIITLGHFGILGLFSLYGMFLVTPVLATIRFSGKGWNKGDAAPVIAISALLLLYMIDCLLNAMGNAIYPLCLGAISSVYGQPRDTLMDVDLDSTDDEATITPIERSVKRRLWPPKPPKVPIATSH